MMITQMQTARRRRHGISLVEILVASLVLGIGLTSVSALVITGLLTARKAERLTIATTAAERQLERLRALGYVGATVDEQYFPSADYTIVQQNANKTGQVQFSVADLPEGVGTISIGYYSSPIGLFPNLKTVEIEVTWAGAQNLRGTVHLASLIANRP